MHVRENHLSEVIISETHLEFSSTSSIKDSCIKIDEKNHKHRDQEPWKDNGNEDDRSQD